MSKKTFSPHMAIAAAGILLTMSSAMPALAQLYRPKNKPNDTSAAASEMPRKAEREARIATSSAERTAAQMTRMIARANKEIENRITRLNALSVRIQAMKKVSAAAKANLKATIDAEIANLTALKAKIATNTDVETMRTDLQSITKAYRIYALIMPQIAILAAADRATVIADAMTTLSQKLAERITAAQTAGNNVSALQTALTDMNTKIADAKTQVTAAQQQVATLKADNGDQAIFDANKEALKAAHEKIRTAMKDLETARKDAQTISKGLKTFAKPSPSPSPTPSAS